MATVRVYSPVPTPSARDARFAAELAGSLLLAGMATVAERADGTETVVLLPRALWRKDKRKRNTAPRAVPRTVAWRPPAPTAQVSERIAAVNAAYIRLGVNTWTGR